MGDSGGAVSPADDASPAPVPEAAAEVLVATAVVGGAVVIGAVVAGAVVASAVVVKGAVVVTGGAAVVWGAVVGGAVVWGAVVAGAVVVPPQAAYKRTVRRLLETPVTIGKFAGGGVEKTVASVKWMVMVAALTSETKSTLFHQHSHKFTPAVTAKGATAFAERVPTTDASRTIRDPGLPPASVYAVIINLAPPTLGPGIVVSKRTAVKELVGVNIVHTCAFGIVPDVPVSVFVFSGRKCEKPKKRKNGRTGERLTGPRGHCAAAEERRRERRRGTRAISLSR
jgi:hypothetical protein